MGDRAPVTVTIYTCPDQATAQKIFAVLHEYDINEEFDLGTNTETTFTLGTQYGNPESSLGSDGDIAEALQEAGVIAHVSQDAKYEYDATTHITHPGLGLFSGDGNNSGEVMVSGATLEALITEGTSHFSEKWGCGPLDVFDVLKRLTGKAWIDVCEVPDGVQTTWTYDEDWDDEVEAFEDTAAVL